MKSVERDLIGQKFEHLTVIARGKDKYSKKGQRRKYWICECDCDNKTIIEVREDCLISKHTKSCGCSKKNNGGQITHGMTGTRIHNVWRSMKGRCYNPNNTIYKYYGGRGIKICEEWLNDFQKFYKWAMENGYNDNLTIERKNVNGNYEPNNCKWATRIEQANNKNSNHFLEFNGEIHTIAEWGRITRINQNIIERRINDLGWSVKDALSVEAMIGNNQYNTRKENNDGQ